MNLYTQTTLSNTDNMVTIVLPSQNYPLIKLIDKTKLTDVEKLICLSFQDQIVINRDLTIENAPDNFSASFSKTNFITIAVKESVDYNAMSEGHKKLVNDFIGLVKSKLA